MARRTIGHWAWPKACRAIMTSIIALGRAGDLAAPRGVFDAMPRRDVVSWTWNALLTALWRSLRDLPAAHNLFDAMPSRDLISCNSMLRRDAAPLFGEMPERNVATVDGLARRGEAARAREVFNAMPERNLVAWAAMINGYGENGMFLEADVICDDAGEECYGLEGDADSARRLFDGIRVKDVFLLECHECWYVVEVTVHFM
ncbi:hypothetical protein ACP70R_017657 [Stipagrostis hirtigluma subsp. patula]